MRNLPLLLALATTLATPAPAEVPRVVTDIAPVHSLVAQVMGDLGSPGLIVPPGTSFHDAGLRPSDAAALAGADLVIWTGTAAVPFLAGPVATLAGQAAVVALLETPGWEPLPPREGEGFEADHDHDHDHGAGGIDPHAWLDPAVAAAWADTIAEALAGADPEHGAAYRAHAQALRADLARTQEEIAARLAPLAGRPWLAAHDATQYFERAFAIPAAGAIALPDAQAPGPARLAALRARIADGGIACILAEPDTPPRTLALLAGAEDGSDGPRVAVADPDGLGLEPGPGLYGALLTGIAAALEECLG